MSRGFSGVTGIITGVIMLRFVCEKWVSWELGYGMKLSRRLVSQRTDFIVRVQPSFEKHGEAPCKIFQFDTKVNILLENKIGKALMLFAICCCQLWIYNTPPPHPLPPFFSGSMTVSHLYVMFYWVPFSVRGPTVMPKGPKIRWK